MWVYIQDRREADQTRAFDALGQRLAEITNNVVRAEFAAYTCEVSTPSGTRSLPAAEVWFRSRDRREYMGGVVLQPEGMAPTNCYNLWQGFGVAPCAGDASPMINLVSMLCGGSVTLADYVLNWF